MAIDKKTIGISSLITLGIVLASLIGPGFFEDPKYYCESESSIMDCPGGLSGGTGTRCYLNEAKDSWDYCKGGWAEITDDYKIQEDEVIRTGLSDKVRCSMDGCEDI